jgi:hypothetical protein
MEMSEEGQKWENKAEIITEHSEQLYATFPIPLATLMIPKTFKAT